METKKQLQKQIEDLQEQIIKLKDKKTIKIKELNIEVETECSQKDFLIKDIVIPKGWRLLTLNEWLELYNNHQNMFIDLDIRSDEIVKQPIKDNEGKYPYWNVWLCNLDLRSDLDGNFRNLYCNGRVRGVRFCKDLKENKND